MHDEFKYHFQIGAIEHANNEIEILVLFYRKRLFLFSKAEVLSESNVCHVLSIKNAISISSISLGLFMRYMKIQFVDSSSVIFITRSKELTTNIVNLINDAFNNSSFADLAPRCINQDRELLELIQVRYLY